MKAGRRVYGVDHPVYRRVRRLVAFMAPTFALAVAVAVLSDEGPNSGLRFAIAGTIFLTTLPVGFAMARLSPQTLWWQREATWFDSSAWFIVYADVGIAGVLFTYLDLEFALFGTVMFAVVGIYTGFVASGVVAGCHVAFTSTVIVVLGIAAYRQGGHDAASVVSRCMASLLAANASVLLIREFTGDIRRTLTAQLAHAAQDPLTGLLNRRGLATAIDRLLADGAQVGFVVADVDDFKSINDDFGHAGGDAALVRLGARLLEAAGGSAVVARTGGEEFAMAVDCRRHHLGDLAERIRGAAHNALDDAPLTVSIGVAMPACGTARAADPGAVMIRGMAVADEAMYAAKVAGGDRAVVHQISIHEDDGSE